MARTPASYDLTGVRGSTFEEDFAYQDEAGAPVDLTGYSAELQVRTLDGQYGTTDADTLVMEATTGADARLAFVGSPTLGTLRLTISADDMLTFNPENAKSAKYAYSLRVFKPAGAGQPKQVIPIVRGKLTVQGETIR